MNRWSSSQYFTYALLLTLAFSAVSNVVIFQPSYASHSNITLDLSELDVKYDPGDDVTITGTIEDLSTEDKVNLDVTGPGTSDDDDLTLDQDEDEFTFNYSIDNGADDGIYTIEVEYDGDSTFAYFLIDEVDDDVTVETGNNSYQPGDTAEVLGQLEDPQAGEDVVEITILDPNGNEVVNGDEEDVDSSDEFSYDYDIDNDDDVHGMYAITVVYDSNQEGYAIFEVEEGSSGSTITASLSKTSYKQGEEVRITGEVDQIEGNDDVVVVVEDPNGDEVFNDAMEPESDKSFTFEFTLEDDAETGAYEATISYIQAGNDKVLPFTVSTSTSGGGGTGSGSGSSGGLTAKLNKVNFLAGETISIEGVVPSIQEDEPVNISIIGPDGMFTGLSAYPMPESDKSYSTSLRLKSSLEPDEDYRTVISYDNKEVTIYFDITGVSTDGPLTVKTDKTTYAKGSTVKISGQISDQVEGQKVIIRAENPNGDVYRYDLATPSTDGSYSYSMVLGGDLEVNGEWVVTAYYGEEDVETTFQVGSGGTGGGTTDGMLKYNLKIEDQTYPIEYEIVGGSAEIEEMIVNYVKKKLVISINADEDGELTLVLPREVIDAVEGNSSDIDYIVTTRDNAIGDDVVVDVSESETDDETRTLVIDYEAGTDIIEIQGTTIVPEFGAISMIILAVAIVGMIVGTAKFSGRASLFKR